MGRHGITQGAQPGSSDDLEGWEALEEGDLCIVMADSPCGIAETNIAL